MPGGLLNLISYGNFNVIINGNPSKTFFKTTYAKYTNFGLQKFRIDFNGLKTLRMNEDSHYTFKIPRYADLLMDTYFVITLPTIWSPMLLNADENQPDISYIPYEFKWIENLGSQLIRKVRFTIGSQIIYEFTGQYLYNMVQRDFSESKKKLFDEMTGNMPELNDPANYKDRNGNYPNAYYDAAWDPAGPEPSINSKTIYIPFNIWSTLSSKLAIPLVSLQYNILQIEVDCRPIQDLFVVRDLDAPNYLTAPYIHADQNLEKYNFYRFLQPPPSNNLIGEKSDNYPIQKTDWYAKIFLLSTYAFLSEEEIRVFAAKPQKYLIKEVHEELFYDITGNRKTRINSSGLVASWMWFYQRSDVKLRNEWSNYTNWPYKETIPYIGEHISNGEHTIPISGQYQTENKREIMLTWGLLFDGKVRENEFESGVFNYIEKYVRTAGNGQFGVYCYNFCLTTDPFQYQPSGAVNLSKFNNIEFEYSTYLPHLDEEARTFTICNPEGELIGINKPVWRIYKYNYNMYVMEERYNVLIFESGQAGLMFSR